MSWTPPKSWEQVASFDTLGRWETLYLSPRKGFVWVKWKTDDWQRKSTPRQETLTRDELMRRVVRRTLPEHICFCLGL